jgi:hypothetical protein
VARRLRLHRRHSAFIRDGLEAGEPVMVAVSALHTEWLREALDGQADVEFVDIEELGRNPAQIIPAWQQFVNTRSGRFRPVRGIGEPIWGSSEFSGVR